jgi:hypothetical protein
VRLDDCKFGTFRRTAGPRCIPNPIATMSAAVQGCRKLQTVNIFRPEPAYLENVGLIQFLIGLVAIGLPLVHWRSILSGKENS